MLGVSSDEFSRPPAKSGVDLEKWLKPEYSDSSEATLSDINTPSFKCLLLPEISRSSLALEPYYYFPEIEDPEFDTALWGIGTKSYYDNTGAEIYKKICREEGIIPLRRVLSSLTGKTLDLKYYGVQEKDMKAICTALLNNNYITNLILEDTYLTPKSVEYLVTVIKNNITVCYLNLRHCRIGYLGAKVLGNCFKTNSDITELDLSFNDLGDGLAFLVDSFKMNKFLKKLNLSHNNLGDDAMTEFREVLEDNYTLVELDLSWNNIFKPIGMKHLMEGLTDSASIETLNISWNGIGEKDAVKHIFSFLKSESTKLKHLDLSYNRITGIPLKMIIAGLKSNESLLSLNIGYNPLLPAEVELFGNILRNTPLKKIDFGEIWIKKSFLPTRNRARKKGIKIIHGGIYSNYKIKGPDIHEMLLKRAKFVAFKQKRKKNKKDYGQWLLGLKDDMITKEIFEDLIKAGNIKLDRDLLEMMGKTFTSKENRRISLNEMRRIYMNLYPDTKLPEKKKKGKKGKGKKK